jgi:chemotaxis protein methyltransferase CheR
MLEIAGADGGRSGPVDEELEALEIQLLLDGVHRRYGFDFREYAYTSLRRRIRKMVHAEGMATISGLQEKVLHDPVCWDRFLRGISVNVTSMFRDPGFYRAIRTSVIPLLRDLPFIRIWHAGCATGEEVYSLAILMEEEGLYDRCRIYATDMNQGVLAKARTAIYPLAAMQSYTRNYLEAGGERAFSRYYTASYGNAIFRSSLKENVVFSQHNLVSDGAFNEFHFILCRNVLIYFSKPLQNRVHELLFASLAEPGFLGLGQRESIAYTPHEDDFRSVGAGDERIYQRI